MTLEAWFLPYTPEAKAKRANPAKPIPEISPVSTISLSPGDASENTRHDGETWQERAAIIEHEAGIPRQWAEAFARVCCMSRPASIPPAHWQRIVDNTGRLLDDSRHLRDMACYGWGVEDVFGVHPGAPINRQDAKGLFLLMREAEVVAIVDAHAIGLRNTRTGNLLFYRQPLNPTPERIMLWELQ